MHIYIYIAHFLRINLAYIFKHTQKIKNKIVGLL